MSKKTLDILNHFLRFIFFFLLCLLARETRTYVNVARVEVLFIFSDSLLKLQSNRFIAMIVCLFGLSLVVFKVSERRGKLVQKKFCNKVRKNP